MKFLKESALILLSFVIVYIWQQTFLSQYTIHTLVALTILYLLLTARKKEFSLLEKAGDVTSVFVLTVMILLLVFATGGLNSTVFFLLYFLSFGLTFAFEPATVFIFTILLTLIFIPDALNNDVFGNFVHIGSLYLIAPFAFFFGKEMKKEEKEKAKLTKRKSTRKKRK